MKEVSLCSWQKIDRRFESYIVLIARLHLKATTSKIKQCFILFASFFDDHCCVLFKFFLSNKEYTCRLCGHLLKWRNVFQLLSGFIVFCIKAFLLVLPFLLPNTTYYFSWAISHGKIKCLTFCCEEKFRFSAHFCIHSSPWELSSSFSCINCVPIRTKSGITAVTFNLMSSL